MVLLKNLQGWKHLDVLQCPKPVCIEGCPVEVKISDFINLVAEGDYLAAAAKIKEDNMLPAICGRVCPQEEQCEVKCVTGKKGEPLLSADLKDLLLILNVSISC